MSIIKKTFVLLSALFLFSALTACSPEVGSKEWCEAMQEKPKGDWTANEAGDFTKYCVLGMHDDK